MRGQGAAEDKTYTSEAAKFPAGLDVGQDGLFSHTSDYSRPIWGETDRASSVQRSNDSLCIITRTCAGQQSVALPAVERTVTHDVLGRTDMESKSKLISRTRKI